MENWYYSKKFDRHFSKRLDFLLYAHDGRGLGHASRSIAIGMAIRRLFPKCKTLFLSGCRQAEALIGPAPLDWIKLPAYDTVIIQGRAEGADGQANFYKSALGELRSDMLASIVEIFQPRCVLVDHSPLGKREELRPALEASKGADTRWVLGMRGIIGKEKGIWSEHSIRLFKEYYDGLLWYGDSRVLGPGYLEALQGRFGVQPQETGYVSRLREARDLMDSEKDPLAGTIAIPWGNEATWAFVEEIRSAIASIGDTYGPWRFFVERERKEAVRGLFENLPYCTIEEVSENYIPSLINSRVSLIYAGYNSLTDILAAQIPSVVLYRDLKDREQEDHLSRLVAHTEGLIHVLPESNTDASRLQTALEGQLGLSAPAGYMGGVNVDGAQIAAAILSEGVACRGKKG